MSDVLDPHPKVLSKFLEVLDPPPPTVLAKSASTLYVTHRLTYKVLAKTRESSREVLATPPESARTKCSCLAIFDRFSAVSWPFLGRFLNFWPFFLQRSFF